MDEEMGERVTDPPPKPYAENVNPTRIKIYPESSTGPWIVFIRRKVKALNIIQISKDLTSRFSDVKEIVKVNKDKIRIVVGSLKQANAIASCELFTREYRAYIPSKEIEIDGVITESSLTVDDIIKHGVGRFKDTILKDVKILECKQLHSVSHEGDKKVYRLSDSFRVTFAGSALPNYVIIDKIRLPVRLFIPRVMNCLNCKQLGHTATYCSNKARCGKCGGSHQEDTCNENSEKCLMCGENSHELPSCPIYKLREDKIKRSLKERSKRSYAEMLKNATPKPIFLENTYTSLFSEQSDSDGACEGTSFVLPGNSRKRKQSSFPKLPRKGLKISPPIDKLHPKPKNSDSKPKSIPPGFGNVQSKQNTITGNNKISTSSEPQPGVGLLKFSEIVDWIFKAFNISEPLKSILSAFLPTIRTFLEQLIAQWPILAAIVSFNG
ncbi:uncharacterized protein LOC131684954 [Topomyia yanbarensis]|uniref:uncharacterized protein LOC131684954 n=1 Tax=Topomyia yanbarensis TaxID=2498891 RepID=UPI00273C283C|nr:uncharacterized protein LOC131684954 [Topomyia yanbarensis]